MIYVIDSTGISSILNCYVILFNLIRPIQQHSVTHTFCDIKSHPSVFDDHGHERADVPPQLGVHLAERADGRPEGWIDKLTLILLISILQPNMQTK